MTLILRIIGLALALALSGCASVLDEDGALAVTPYDLEEHGRIVIEARVNGQGPFSFALDTAASISVVFENLGNELALEPIPGRSVRIQGAVASDTYPLVAIESAEVGRETWLGPEIALLPGETTASANIDGILGVDFLGRYAVGFTTHDRAVRLYPPDLVAQRSYRGWASVPLDAEYIGDNGAAIFFLDIYIGDQRIPAIFDLGAGLNLINWAAARNLGLRPKEARDDSSLSGAIGTAPVPRHVRVDEITTGRIRWQNEIFTVTDLEIFDTFKHGATACAILGAGLFTQRDFIIDFPRARLLVKVAMDEVDVFEDLVSDDRMAP